MKNYNKYRHGRETWSKSTENNHVIEYKATKSRGTWCHKQRIVLVKNMKFVATGKYKKIQQTEKYEILELRRKTLKKIKLRVFFFSSP